MRRGLPAVGAAVALIAALVWLHGPKRPPGGGSPRPPTLATVWPLARPFAIPAMFPDGSTYTPAVVLDADTSIGTVAGADEQDTALVVVPATGPPRVLQSQSATESGSFDGIAASADQVYWMHTVSDATGAASTSLWTAPRTGGTATRLTTDVGAPEFFGSGYDVQVVGDRLTWAASRPGATEVRSIPLSGGAVGIRVVPGAWALSAWPWLVTAPNASDQPMRLRDLDTGTERAVKVPPGRQATCGPVWCRTIPGNAAVPAGTDLVRPDGSDRRAIGGPTDAAIASDVALLDRFEVLMTTVTSNSRSSICRLSLYDIARRRTVLVEPAATNAGARGDFVWWSTGDDETLAWHGLDLRTLT